MVVYDSAANYVNSCTTLEARIAAIDNIISSLLTTALTAVGKGDIAEYSLDDGQTKIKTMYRSADEITKSIEGFEKIKQAYINQLDVARHGRRTRLVDSKNFPR